MLGIIDSISTSYRLNMENSQPNLQSEAIDKNTIMQLMREIMEQEGRKIIAPMLEEKLLEKPKASRIYGEEWIVLQNRLLNAISNLDLNERRLIMFLSPLVRKEVDKDPHQQTFIVKVKDFQDEYEIKSKAYYQELENICNSLQHKTYEFWNFSANKKYKSKVKVTWITKGDYKSKQGEVHIDLHKDVIEMLTVFDKTNPFTKYERQMIIKLGCYGIILFELISSCLYQKDKSKAYTIEYLREKFNCIASYPVISEFKRNVLDKAIVDIEKHTPIRITYTQNKKGRVVTEIVFSFKDTSKTDKNLKDKTAKAIEHSPEQVAPDTDVKLLSPKQADFFASKLANNQNFSSKFAKIGEDMQPFIDRISDELQRDIKQVTVYMPYLLKLGFKKSDS